MGGRQVPRWEVGDVTGAVVVVDTLRAFTTAAYAFAGGAAAIYLVGGVDEAIGFAAARPGTLIVGESGGLRPEGFDVPNSPAMISRLDLEGRTLVQRTSAGTQGVIAARSATRSWAASLVCASATARAVERAGLGEPTYVITGRFLEDPSHGAEDDEMTADLIERARLGEPLRARATAEQLLASDEAARTLAHGPEHCDPLDIEFAARVDHVGFAMEVVRDEHGLRLVADRS